MAYDLTVLSPIDFEDLSRDLLQAELGVRFEAFTVGRDGGTDLRYAIGRHQKWIVQCKHFARSGWKRLLAQLKREAPKVAKLAPERYIVTTSVGLTPANKDEIVDLLSPWLKSSSDVYGMDDIRNLLTIHSGVEKTHFKLWLASTAVLERLLNAATFARTESLTAEISRQVRLYVSNESFGRALDILSADHVVIIAGIPGIGKTLLARMLMLHHLAQDFEAISVSSDIDEANRLYDPARNQFFYYDDFLGTAFDEAMAKNEDARLSDFIQRVSRAPNKRLVLTTREYILKRAMGRYERLHKAIDDDLKCIVRLEDYTGLIRGKVVYNHLYFSDLPGDTIHSFCRDRLYQKVIQHQNFSPRLIEFAIKQGERSQMDVATFSAFVDRVLNEPAELWDHAFRSQLLPGAQAVLLAMLMLPSRTPIEDLSRAAIELASVRSGVVMPGLTVIDHLKQLDGTFIAVAAIGPATRSARFFSPAIADYLLNVIDAAPSEVDSLLRSAVFFEQVVAMWSAAVTADSGMNRFPGVWGRLMSNTSSFVEALQRTFEMSSCLWEEHFSSTGNTFYRLPPNLESRLCKILEIARVGNLPRLQAWAEDQVRIMATRWPRLGDRAAAAQLIGLVSVDARIRTVVRDWSLGDIDDLEDFEAALHIFETAPDLVDDGFTSNLLDAFELYVQGQTEYILEDEDDPSKIETVIDEVNELARRLGAEPPWDEEELRERIARLEARSDDFDPDLAREAHGDLGGRGSFGDEARVDLLFDSLARSLDGDDDE